MYIKMFKNVCANLFIKAQLWKWAKYLSYHHTMELKVMLIEEYLMVMEKCSYFIKRKYEVIKYIW